MKLQHVMLGIVPFILVGAYWHVRYVYVLAQPRQLTRPAQVEPITASRNVKQVLPKTLPAVVLTASRTVHQVPPTTLPPKVTQAIDPAAGSRPTQDKWPPATRSSKLLIDGSPNWLPVPNAEGDNPDDMAWRRLVREDSSEPCPSGRKPYHTILTAQASLYQEWQTKIFYYHFRKAQRAGGRCTEMVGFTRLLAGRADGLMSIMPTVAVPEVGHDKTRGFPVINRPWSILKFLETPDWKERIVEDYVYIAETDHLLLRDMPNRATPELNVAFFFPYMSPKDRDKATLNPNASHPVPFQPLPPYHSDPIPCHPVRQ